MLFVVCVLFVLLRSAVSAGPDSPCTTPNGEHATCVSVKSCRVISLALAYLDKDAVDFARESSCGFDGTTPLVCCGSKGQYATTPSPELLVDRFVEISTVNTATNLPSSPAPIDNINLPDHSLCGIQVKQELNRIVGGYVTELYEFPWMAVLKYKRDDGRDGGFRCGGTLITQKYVLTAAQCLSIKGYNLTEVRLGEWKLSTPKDCVKDSFNETTCSDDIMDVTIAQKLAHPYYSKKSGNNDIALLRLEKKVKYTEYIRPICLPPSDLPPPPVGMIMNIAGWGVTEKGTQSDVKLKVEVPVISNEICEVVHTNFTHVNPNQSCAGGAGGKDACRGDSGGPLMRTYHKKDHTDEEQWYQEGIVYRGLGCGRKGAPSLYTRVSRYTSWILTNLK